MNDSENEHEIGCSSNASWWWKFGNTLRFCTTHAPATVHQTTRESSGGLRVTTQTIYWGNLEPRSTVRAHSYDCLGPDRQCSGPKEGREMLFILCCILNTKLDCIQMPPTLVECKGADVADAPCFGAQGGFEQCKKSFCSGTSLGAQWLRLPV